MLTQQCLSHPLNQLRKVQVAAAIPQTSWADTPSREATAACVQANAQTTDPATGSGLQPLGKGKAGICDLNDPIEFAPLGFAEKLWIFWGEVGYVRPLHDAFLEPLFTSACTSQPNMSLDFMENRWLFPRQMAKRAAGGLCGSEDIFG